MTWGMTTWDETGTVTTHTPSMSSEFFNSAIVTSGQAAFDTTGFVQHGGVWTPLAKFNLSWGLPAVASISGSYDPISNSYKPPTKYAVDAVNGWFLHYGSVSPIPSSVMGFGKRPVSDGSWGALFVGENGNLVIDQNYRSYYIHPSDAGFIRSGVASSLPSFITGQFNWTSVYDQPQVQNITFDQPYLYPPLIFITSSSGPIAFNGMIRNADGLFIGASITARSSFSKPAIWSGLSAYVSNTYSFSYFVVSQETSINDPDTDWGLRVFDALGNAVFDSSFFVPAFRKTTISTPYMYFPGNYPERYLKVGSYTGSKGPTTGVCINNLPSICGLSSYASYQLPVSMQMVGPVCAFGRFLNVGLDTFTVEGDGAFGMYAPHAIGAESYDFHLQNTPMMDVYTANYIHA